MPPGRLTALQARILAVLSELEPSWVLTGGAALAGFHVHHRSTRDLDLVWQERPRLDEIVAAVRDRLLEAGLDVKSIQQALTFHRMEVRSGEAMCLLDLVADPALRQAAPETFEVEGRAILVESRHTLLVNKLCALLGRRELRDLIDVRELVRHGCDLERASGEAVKKDGGYSPLVLSWILKDTPLATMVRAAGLSAREASELEEFRTELIERLTKDANPGDRR